MSFSYQEQIHSVTTEDLHFRKEASSKAQSLMVIPAGDTVVVLDNTHSLWYKAEYKGEVGFLSKNFLEELNTEIPEKEELMVTEQDPQTTGNILWVLLFVISFFILLAALINSLGKGRKSKSTTTVLAFFVGGFGMHRFYLNQLGKGVLMLVFSWTLIPFLIGFYDFLYFLFMKETLFEKRFNYRSTKTRPAVTGEQTSSDYYSRTYSKPVVTISKSENLNTRRNNDADSSIIDISQKYYNLNVLPPDGAAPYWPKFYVYSFQDLGRANKAQKVFYQKYRDEFHRENLLDINGNTNYAFILYFDLIGDYHRHQNIEKLYRQFKLLGKSCPATRRYALNELHNLLRKRSDSFSEELLSNLEDSYFQYQEGFSDYNPHLNKLGHIYKEQLSLSVEESSWLNKFYLDGNVFNRIDGCRIAIVKQFLLLLKKLKEEVNFESEIGKIREIIKASEPGGWEYSRYTTTNEYFLCLFKRTENQIRDAYGYTRRISDNFYSPIPQVLELFEKGTGVRANQILTEISPEIISPDKETEIELNSIQVTRWKSKFEQYKELIHKKDLSGFISGIRELEETNSKNPSLEQIFFEAAKEIAKVDKKTCLKFYASYVYYDQISNRINDKDLPKTIQKRLFQNDQQKEFEDIINELKSDRDLEKAMDKIEVFYVPKRRKIVLNQKRIIEEKKNHETTVEILNQYLIQPEQLEDSTIEPEKTQEYFKKEEIPETSPYIVGLFFNEVQRTLLDQIVDNSYYIPQNNVNELALQHGLMKNQLIDSINETCSAFLDGEVLIEEEDNNYIIEESFYQELLKK